MGQSAPLRPPLSRKEGTQEEEVTEVCPHCGFKLGVHTLECPLMRKAALEGDSDWHQGMRVIHGFLDSEFKSMAEYQASLEAK